MRDKRRDLLLLLFATCLLLWGCAARYEGYGYHDYPDYYGDYGYYGEGGRVYHGERHEFHGESHGREFRDGGGIRVPQSGGAPQSGAEPRGGVSGARGGKSGESHAGGEGRER